VEANAQVFDIESILSIVRAGVKRMQVQLPGLCPSVKFAASMRLRMLAAKGVTCVGCGRQGSFFALEFETLATPHFNLYTDDGVLMTMDHIRPRSRGGPHQLSNLQVMCSPCNASKADHWSPDVQGTFAIG
jgi:5-methylcytosine-specific restriction endonuclease McrA